MQAIFLREMPIPDQIDMFLGNGTTCWFAYVQKISVSREMAATDDSAIKAVINVDKERILLEKQAEELAVYDDDGRPRPSLFRVKPFNK